MSKEILELKKENAIAAYKDGNVNDRALLERLYGKQHFITDICERVKDLKDACAETGKDIETLFDGITDPYKQAEKAIETFAEAMREGTPPGESWYYPYFLRSSGGGFSFYDYGNALVYSPVGARLRVPTAKKATHMGKCMVDWYKQYING